MDARTRRRPHSFVEPVEIDANFRDHGPRVNIVLVAPEIPQNTGTIVRLAAATACPLHLVEPLGFELTERAIRRAGLDYWEHATVTTYPSYEALCAAFPSGRFWLTSKRATQPYTAVTYAAEDFLVFGCETRGLPAEILAAAPERTLGIPMFGPVRSLNLANAVSVVVYEALRQLRGF